MSKYKNQIDIITRTKKFLSLKDKLVTDYEKTFFLNCALGLLAVPQQISEHNDIEINEEVNLNDWGIDTTAIQTNNLSRGSSEFSASNIAYHFRNSLCHYLFDVIDCNKDLEEITNITIIDKNQYKNNTETFRLAMSFDDFQKFILKYADEVLKVLLKL